MRLCPVPGAAGSEARGPPRRSHWKALKQCISNVGGQGARRRTWAGAAASLALLLCVNSAEAESGPRLRGGEGPYACSAHDEAYLQTVLIGAAAACAPSLATAPISCAPLC